MQVASYIFFRMNRPHFASRLVGWLIVLFALTNGATVRAEAFTMIESTFDVPGVMGNPYDFAENDVKVAVREPDGGTITLPAYFDGAAWHVRHAPTKAGKYEIVSISRNGVDVKPQRIEPKSFDIERAAARGYVRIDPKQTLRFMHDDGSLYFPLGFNRGWRNPGELSYPDMMARMNAVGANWIRIWMNHWDRKNLDWIEDQVVPAGTYDEGVAKQWDEIVAAADEQDVRIQLALQHHGPYSTRADSNWPINPWNKANGGWLESPADFFTDAKAKTLTKAKYRYILARWGYSPSIMAWELFNEVENTDAYQSNPAAVFAWHEEMAAFIRAHDPYRHLITTSSRTSDAALWTTMDFYNPHVYAPDIITAIQTLEGEKLDRPYFYGEIGAAAFGEQPNPPQTVHDLLWASLMSQSSGAAQYWYWDLVEKRDLFAKYAAASAFLKQSDLLAQPNLLPIEVIATTAKRGALRFGPGTGWAASKTTQFDARTTGFVDGVGGMSTYLQGTLNEKNKAMFPFMELKVNFAEPGTFSISVDEITADGAQLDVSIDGKLATSLAIGAPATPQRDDRPRRNPRVDTTLLLPIPAGEHVIRIENNGRDWVHLRQFVLSPYAPELAVLGKGSSDYAALWVYRREPGNEPVDGTISVPGLAAGNVKIHWFDTHSGKSTRSEVIQHGGGELTFAVGPVAQDVAIWIEKTADAPTTQNIR